MRNNVNKGLATKVQI